MHINEVQKVNQKCRFYECFNFKYLYIILHMVKYKKLTKTTINHTESHAFPVFRMDFQAASQAEPLFIGGGYFIHSCSDVTNYGRTHHRLCCSGGGRRRVPFFSVLMYPFLNKIPPRTYWMYIPRKIKTSLPWILNHNPSPHYPVTFTLTIFFYRITVLVLCLLIMVVSITTVKNETTSETKNGFIIDIFIDIVFVRRRMVIMKRLLYP